VLLVVLLLVLSLCGEQLLPTEDLEEALPQLTPQLEEQLRRLQPFYPPQNLTFDNNAQEFTTYVR
jgi:Tfp pilus assembly protein PilP